MYKIDFFMPGYICVITGERVEATDYCLVYLNTTKGKKLFQVWISRKYGLMKRSERINLIQETIGDIINIKTL